jgi:hypothetical protein
MMELEDQINPAQDTIQPQVSPIELPFGLTESEIATKAVAWNASWQLLYDKLCSKWEQNYTQFRHFDKSLDENISQRTYEVWANIQSEIPHLVNSIFTKSEVVKGMPKFQDIENKSFKVNNYVNKMITVGNKGRAVASDALQDFLVFGTVISKTFWDNEEKPEFDLNTQTWIESYEGKPSVYNVDIFNWAIDPTYSGHDPNKAEWTRERIFFKKEDLKKMMEKGEIATVSDEVLTGSKKEDSGKDIRDRIDGISATKQDKIYVDEFWCNLYYTDENGQQKSGKYYFWLLNNTTLLKFKVNIFNSCPFKVARCYRLSHEFFGIGDVDVMASLSEHINVTHTQGALLAKKTGQKLTILGPSVGISPQELKSKENGIITVKDMNAIKTENTTAGADLGTLINYKASLKADLNNAVGINDIMRGESVGDQTATEASILNSNSSARLAMKLANFQDEWLSPVAASFYNLSKQFIDTYSFFIENQLVSLTQADFAGDYDWVPQGSTAVANKNLRIRQMTEIGMQLAQAAQMAAKSGGVVRFPAFDLGAFTQNEIMSLLEVQNPSQYFQEVPVMSPQGMPNPSTGSGNQDIPAPLPVAENPLEGAGLEGVDMGAASSVLS